MKSPTTFFVTIAGVHRYDVRIPDQQVYNHLGDELDGLAVESRRLILISPTVQPERREEILGHEIEHAWSFHVPKPSDVEERAQLTATMMQSLRMDLDRQGGIQALKMIKPERMTLPYRAVAVRHFAGPAVFRSPDKRRCGDCDAAMMCGSIHTGGPELHEGLGQYQVKRWFRCEVCNALNVWWEVSTTDGRPTGRFVEIPPPRLLRGADATEWIAEHSCEFAA